MSRNNLAFYLDRADEEERHAKGSSNLAARAAHLAFAVAYRERAAELERRNIPVAVADVFYNALSTRAVIHRAESAGDSQLG